MTPAKPVWRPAEADKSIRPGWFYHPEEDGRVRSVDDLVDLYFASVGRNEKLLLNVATAPDGLLHETDVSRLAACHDRLRALFATDVAAGARATWRRTGERTAVAELALEAVEQERLVDRTRPGELRLAHELLEVEADAALGEAAGHAPGTARGFLPNPSLDRTMEIGGVRVLAKEGGKSGSWSGA